MRLLSARLRGSKIVLDGVRDGSPSPLPQRPVEDETGSSREKRARNLLENGFPCETNGKEGTFRGEGDGSDADSPRFDGPRRNPRGRIHTMFRSEEILSMGTGSLFDLGFSWKDACPGTKSEEVRPVSPLLLSLVVYILLAHRFLGVRVGSRGEEVGWIPRLLLSYLDGWETRKGLDVVPVPIRTRIRPILGDLRSDWTERKGKRSRTSRSGREIVRRIVAPTSPFAQEVGLGFVSKGEPRDPIVPWCVSSSPFRSDPTTRRPKVGGKERMTEEVRKRIPGGSERTNQGSMRGTESIRSRSDPPPRTNRGASANASFSTPGEAREDPGKGRVRLERVERTPSPSPLSRPLPRERRREGADLLPPFFFIVDPGGGQKQN